MADPARSGPATRLRGRPPSRQLVQLWALQAESTLRHPATLAEWTAMHADWLAILSPHHDPATALRLATAETLASLGPCPPVPQLAHALEPAEPTPARAKALRPPPPPAEPAPLPVRLPPMDWVARGALPLTTGGRLTIRNPLDTPRPEKP